VEVLSPTASPVKGQRGTGATAVRSPTAALPLELAPASDEALFQVRCRQSIKGVLQGLDGGIIVRYWYSGPACTRISCNDWILLSHGASVKRWS
jgi:hypothetical protein